MITVCHFATLTRWGGVENMLMDLLLSVKQEQVRHVLIATSGRPDIVDAFRQAGVLCFQPQGYIGYDPRKLVRIAKWMKDQDVRIVHSYNAYANSWASISTLLAGISILVTGEHGTIWNVTPPMSWLDQWANSRARLVVANSHASAKLIEIKYRIPASKIQVVHNAVADVIDTKCQLARDALGIEVGCFVVGSVGRLDTPKDYATYIRSASAVLESRENVVFVLIGGGPLEADLWSFVCDLGIQNRFIMTGERSDARFLMQGFDVFVSTSVYESFGNTLIEAALCRKPVIAPNVDGIPEVIQDGVTGVLLQPVHRVIERHLPGASPLAKKVIIDGRLSEPKSVSHEDLAQAIINLLDRPHLCKSLGEAGYSRAIELFSLNRYRENLEDIYLTLAQDEHWL